MGGIDGPWEAKLCGECFTLNSVRDMVCAQCIAPLRHHDNLQVVRLKTEEINTNALGPFTRDSETSRKAALDNYPRSGTQRARVLEWIISSGTYGATRDEIAANLRLPDSGTDARVLELMKGGWIEQTEETRETRAGSQASVLVATTRARYASGRYANL